MGIQRTPERAKSLDQHPSREKPRRLSKHQLEENIDRGSVSGAKSSARPILRQPCSAFASKDATQRQMQRVRMHARDLQLQCTARHECRTTVRGPHETWPVFSLPKSRASRLNVFTTSNLHDMRPKTRHYATRPKVRIAEEEVQHVRCCDSIPPIRRKHNGVKYQHNANFR